MNLLNLKSELTAVLAAATLCLNHAFCEEIVLDRTAAVVNSGIILESELNAEQRRVEAAAAARNIELEPLAARKTALEGLITRSLLLQMAENQGFDLNDMQLDQALAQTAAKNNTSVENLLSSFGSDASEAEQRRRFKTEFILSELRGARVRSRISVSDSEIDNLALNLKNRGNVEPFYHLAQIIVPLSLNPTEEEYTRSQRQARDLVNQLRRGLDFSEAEARYPSEDGGDLGYLPESQVPLPFVPALIKARSGDVLGPFRSPAGLHILKVYDITNEAVIPVRTYDAAHILLKTSVIFSDEAARAELERLRADILAGKISFEEAAKTHSQDPGSSVNGGNLGYAVPDRYDPAFARGLVALKPGEISQPLKSSFGWHLIYLKDIKTDTSSDEAYRDRARAIIYEREFAQAARLWELEQRANAYIRILDPELVRSGVKFEARTDD